MRGFALAAALVAAFAAGAVLVALVQAGRTRRLTEAARRVASGDASALPATARGGQGALAAAVNRALGRLEAEAGSASRGREIPDRILAALPDAVVLVAGDGTVRLANAAAARYLGSPPQSLEGLLPLGLAEAVRRTFSTGEPSAVDVEVGSSGLWLRGEVFPASEGSVLLVVRDVTEARRVEAMRHDFVAHASHELKTPAAIVRAAAETIQTAAAEDPAMVPRFAAQLDREAVRLSRIVEDLLDLSRLEVGSQRTDLVPMDTLAGEEVARLQAVARDAGVALAVDARPVPPVQGSSRDLALLVRNLVDNAVRYTERGGRVEVSVRGEDGVVVLRVADTGLGIPSRELPRIFERFYRVDRARSRETGGTGLGLAIVKHVVENHGGTVTVESELARGTAFEARLPARES